MKRYLFLCCLIWSFSSLGQMITSPAPLTIEANATNIDAGDFVVNWPNNTDQILISLNLEYQSGATLSFPTTTGITRNYGYNSWLNVSSIVFYGTRDYVNAALAAMTISMGSVKTAVKINIQAATNDATLYYNPTNNHYYKFVSGAVTYTAAKSGASAQATFRGKTPYLATITSQSENDFINSKVSQTNVWIALSDAVTEGYWILDAGPEANTNVWRTTVAGVTNTTYTSYAATGTTTSGQYTNWCANEPNNSDGSRNGEDAAVAKSGGATCWNDLADGNSGSIGGYLVEYSADFPAGSDYTGVYNSYAVHNNDLAYSLSSTTTLSSTAISNLPNAFGGLQINAGNIYTPSINTNYQSNKIVFNGTGKMVLTNSTTKWTAGTSSTDETFIHSPSTNSNPTYWSVSSTWLNDTFYENAPFPNTINPYHLTPWINSPQAWSAGANDGNQYIILNYDVPTYITGIVVQGRRDMVQYVTAANVDVSLDGITWRNVLTNASINSNNTEGVTVLFPTVEYAKYVKLMPTTIFGHTSLRFGLLIKSNELVKEGQVLRLDATNPISYKGTGTAWNDLSGNGNHGTLLNSPTYYPNDRGYFAFNGSTQSVSGPAITTTSGNNSRTVMVWYKSSANANTHLLDKGAVNSDDAGEQLVVVYTGGAGSSGMSYPPTNNGGIALALWGNDVFCPIASATVFDGKWHFIAYTYDNSNHSVRICFDGNFPSTGYYWNINSWSTKTAQPFVLARNINTTNNPYLVGQTRQAFWGLGGTYANASIPFVQIYNRALSEAEILVNYNATKSTYGK